MQLTLHLTNECNLNCTYCFVKRGNQRMSREVAFKAIDLSLLDSNTTGILFYGGEPLLERQLIADVIDYTKAIKKKTGHHFHYKITTNGILLDEDFLTLAKEVNMVIGLSHDGPAHDDCRLFRDGRKSFAIIEEKMPLLLDALPYAISMSVTDPSTIHRANDIIQFAYDKGFRYLHLSHNYCRTAPWTTDHLAVLEQEYDKMAQLYLKWTLAEEKFYLSPFDAKILSHLKGEKYNKDRLYMAQNQPSVNTDGKLYYSSKYLEDKTFEIGDVYSGIDSKKRGEIHEKSLIPSQTCQACAIRTRCNYAYDSLVAKDGHIIADVAPMHCAHEQLITPIVDRVAEQLYKEKSPLFIQKHYNKLYPVMSLVEDMNN